MKLLYYETLKLLKNKLFILLFIGLTAVSLTAFVWAQISLINSEEYTEEKLAVQSSDEYRSVLTELNTMSADEALQKANDQKKLYEMCVMISTIMSNNGETMDVQSALDALKKQDEEMFDKAMPLVNESTDLREKLFLYDCMIKKYQYIKNYRSFIDGMAQRAEHQLSFSVFNENDAFSAANIRKTVGDFEHLKTVEIKADNYLFIEHGTSFFITDMLTLAVLFILCVCIFMQEREKGLLLLVKSCRNGHSDTAVSKLLTLGIFTAVTVVVFYGSEIIASGIIYGFPNLNAPVQSMQSFMDCSLKISAGEYLILYLLSKLLILLTAALLFSAVFNLFGSTALIWLVSLGFMALEYILYLTVSPKSSFNYPHYIDLFFFSIPKRSLPIMKT